MGCLLLLLFVVAPVADLWLLVQIGRDWGLLPTLGLVIGTAWLGLSLLRAQSLRILSGINADLAGGRMPGQGALDGLAVMAGAALLIAPGLMTDALGLLILFRPTRSLLQGAMRKWMERAVAKGSLRVHVIGGWPPPGGPPIEGEAPLGLDPSKEIRLPPPEEGR